MIRKLIEEFICGSLVLMFLYTALEKLLNINQFHVYIGNQAIPRYLMPAITYSIPIIELIAAVLIIAGKTRRSGLYISVILMSIFSLYVFLVILGVFQKQPCNCGDLIQHLSWNEHMVFNLLFTGLSIIVIYMNKNSNSTKNKNMTKANYPVTRG
ncbi:MauE/DoxX family redox-associated membrane protein [Rhizosphaericola mali]|uniref:Methylamine utilisation protein MauE domain-containing protein n=1 Tax=Rhizosphaericola mali TaxID=2545455 RepID=A0A5P2FWR0_9BACT|nr:MauE/DoxX family redox-associated membrane protein [Rhizosphaericola mali]QES87615.1 hypothetical protein E0W69_002670 [Rhizosphaericola mali]